MFKLRKLEDRIVLDGAGMVDALGEAHDHEVHDSIMHDYAQNGQDFHNGDDGIDGQEPLFVADDTQDDGGVHVLVISSDINDADDLAAAAKDGVLVVRYDASGTTMEDLSGLIREALEGQEADTIAFAAHNAGTGQLHLTRSDIISSDSLESDGDQQAFWESVGNMVSEGGRIDLLACNVADGAFVSKIEDLSGADVAASSDPTGNEAYAGDWVLESDGVDVQSTYFDSARLAEFDGVMQNNAPVLKTNNPLNVSAEGQGVINENYLLVTDPDSADWAGALTYSLSSIPDDGILYFDADGSGKMDGAETALKAGDTFTQAQIYTDRLTYLHDGARDNVETFQFNVSDSAGLTTGYSTFTINVTQNVSPVIVANSGMTVPESSQGVVDGNMLNVIDGDNTTDNLTYTLKSSPAHGDLWFDLDGSGDIDNGESPLLIGSTFTQAQVNTDNLTYRHNGKYQGPLLDGFSFNVKDDTTSGNVSGVFRITVDEVNDAPAKAVIKEITVKNEPVAITSAHLTFTDADNSPYYLTYTLETPPEHGYLYLFDPGKDGIEGTSDDILSFLGKGNTFTQTDINFGALRFVRGDYEGPADVSHEFTFTVSDPGGQFATNPDNGTNIFGFNVTVEDLNEKPYIFRADNLKVDEGESKVIGRNILEAVDPDDSDSPDRLTYKITGFGDQHDSSFYGKLLLDGESLNIGDTFTQADINDGKLSYTYNDALPEEYYRDAFQFTVSDDGGVDKYGNTAPKTSYEGNFVILIENVNDRPVLEKNDQMVIDENKSDVLTNYLTTTDPDSDDKPGNLIYTLESVPDRGWLYIDENNNEKMDTYPDDPDKNEVALAVGATFTQNDLGSVRYSYDADTYEPDAANPGDSFTFKVSDDGDPPLYAKEDAETAEFTTYVFDVKVNNVNDVPVRETLNNITVGRDAFTQVTDIKQTDLEFTDVDDGAEDLTYTLTYVSSNLITTNTGLYIENGMNDIKLTANSTFTQKQVNDGLLKYYTIGQSVTSQTFKFSFTVADDEMAKTDEQEFEIKIVGTNYLPEVKIGEPDINEGSDVRIGHTYLSATDDETYDPTKLVYTMTTDDTPHQYGTMYFDTDKSRSYNAGDIDLDAGETFTQQDIYDGRIRYIHESSLGDDDAVIYDSFNFKLQDEAGETTTNGIETLKIKINGSDTLPTIVPADGGVNNGMDVDEDATKVIDNTMLRVVDPDYELDEQKADEIIYVLQQAPNQSVKEDNFLFIDNGDGIWNINDDTKIEMTGITEFTQKDIDDNKLMYYNYSESTNTPGPPTDMSTYSDSFVFTIKDSNGAAWGEGPQTFDIKITPNTNDVPVRHSGASFTMDNVVEFMEGDNPLLGWNITTGILRFTDGDDVDDKLTYRLMEIPENGTLYLYKGDAKERQLSVGDEFTQDEIEGNLQYFHNGDEGNDSFKVIVRDPSGGQSELTTVDIEVKNVNDDPVLSKNEMTVTEGDVDIKITKDHLTVTDPDHEAKELTYTIDFASMAEFNGTLKFDGTVLDQDNNVDFTQEDITNGKLTYTHDGSEDAVETVVFSVKDSADDPGELVEQEFKINVIPVNDSPVLESNDGINISEGGTAIMGDDALLEVTDPDHDNEYLIYTLTDAPDHGTLQMNDNGKVITIAKDGKILTDGEFSQAVIDGHQLYYIHNGDEPDSDPDTVDDFFKFKVTDSGAPGPNIEIGEFKVEVKVSPENDNPVAVNNSMTVLEDTASAIDQNSLLFTDGDDPAENLTYTLDSVPTLGYMFFDKDGDGSWDSDEAKLVAGDTFTQKDISDPVNGKLTYQNDFKGADLYVDTFKFQIADNTDGITTDQTFTINVTNVNDAPEISTTGLTVWEGQGIGMDGRTGVIDGTKLQAFDGDDDPENLTYKVTSLGTADNSFSGKLFFDNNGNREFDTGDTLISVNSEFTQEQVNKGTLTFQHDGADQMTETFEFTVSDDGLDSSGNPIPVETTDGTFEISVFGVNDPPVIDAPSTVNAAGGEELSFSGANAVSISDADSGIGKMTVIVDLKPDNDGNEIGSISVALNIEGSSVESSTSIITIEGTQEAVNNVLDTLTFTPNSDFIGNAYIAIEAMDNGNSGQGLSESDSEVITVSVAKGEPGPPLAEDSTVMAGEDMVYTFEVSDFGFNQDVQGIFVIPVSENGELQRLTDEGWKTIIDPMDPTQDPITTDQIDKGNLRFKPGDNENGSNYSQFMFRVYNEKSDGTRVYAETANTMTLNVMPLNDAPENIVPGMQVVQAGKTLSFDGNNRIQVRDVDFDSGIMQKLDHETEMTVQLQVANGVLNGLDGVDATVEGNGTKNVRITGTLAEVNAELAGLTYEAQGVGTDTIIVTTGDGGNYGGLPMSDSDTVKINITEDPVTGGGTLPDDPLRMNSSSPFTFQFNEFASEVPADRYEITGKPDWLGFKESSRTFYYVRDITGVAVSGTYEIEVTAYYDQSGIQITDKFTLEVAGLNRELVNALELLDDNSEYIVPDDSDGMAVQEVMMARAVTEGHALVSNEMLEALNLLEGNSPGLMA